MCKFEFVLQELIISCFMEFMQEVRTSANPMSNELKGEE